MIRLLALVIAFLGLVVWCWLDLGAQKLVARCMMPLGLCWLGLGTLALVAFRQGAIRVGLSLVALFLLLGLAGNAWVGTALMQRLEAQVPKPEATHWDAVALLGGGLAITSAGDPQLGNSGDRLRVAAGLVRAGAAPCLVITGPSSAVRDEIGGNRRLLLDWGVPEGAMIGLTGPRNTKEEVLALRQLVQERGWKRIAVVTSAWHLPRALALCRAHEVACDGIPADQRASTSVEWWQVIPGHEGATLTHLALYEMLGRLVGR